MAEQTLGYSLYNIYSERREGRAVGVGQKGGMEASGGGGSEKGRGKGRRRERIEWRKRWGERYIKCCTFLQMTSHSFTD